MIAEAIVILLHFMTTLEIIQLGYLWYNAIGCALTILIGWMFNGISKKDNYEYKGDKHI